MRTDVMGIPFDNVTMTEAVDAALALIEQEGNSYCVTPNSEIVYEAMDNPALKEVLCGADLILPDGAGVVLGSRILGNPVKEKVAGIDFAAHLFAALAGTEHTFFFLGGKPGIAEKAAEAVRASYSGIRITGCADGYFSDDAEAVAAVNEKSPDVLLVCLGAPKQEFFMATHKDKLKTRFMIGLGGSLDGFAGEVKRAPQWMIRCNLEWLYRLICEPSRIGRMMRLPKFMGRVIKRRAAGS